MRKIIEGIGFLSLIIGAAGVAGSIEQGGNLWVAAIMFLIGVIVVGITAYMEEYDGKNRNKYNSHDHSRISFL